MDHRDQESAVTPAEVPEWRAVIERRLDELRKKILGLEPTPRRTLAELSKECQVLAAAAVWFEEHGNITRASERLGTSRRALRGRITAWREKYPQIKPSPLPRPPRASKPCAPRAKAERVRPKLEDEAP